MSSLAQQIEGVLAGTQCRACGYESCRAYAEALAGEAERRVGLCAPGGVRVMNTLKDLVKHAEVGLVEPDFKPHLVRIEEQDCIGCTLCIQACPTDAIVGAAKQIHTVLPEMCSGCGLCVPVCPVECIERIEVPIGHMLTVRGGDRSISLAASAAVWGLVRAKDMRKNVVQREIVAGREVGEVPPIVEVQGDLAAKVAAARGRAREKYTVRVKPVLPKLLRKKKGK